MHPEPATGRIQVRWQLGDKPGQHVIQTLKDIKDSPHMTENLRQQWIQGVVESFSSKPDSALTVRPRNFLLHQDGSVETLSSEEEGRTFYPCRSSIPERNVHGLDEADQVKRAEKFALGSLLYEVMTTNEPFEELSDDEVQDHYRRGVFPDDAFSMATGPYILGCWSLEFEKEMEKLIADSRKVNLGTRFHSYAKAHPFLLASQIAGGVVMTASLAAPAILGAVGFGAVGPIANSAATAWQASQGLVQAGGLFSWCQSAAMGGAAVNGIIAGGVAGGSVALTATGAGFVLGQTVLTPEKMKEIFRAVYRKGIDGAEMAAYAEKSEL